MIVVIKSCKDVANCTREIHFHERPREKRNDEHSGAARRFTERKCRNGDLLRCSLGRACLKTTHVHKRGKPHSVGRAASGIKPVSEREQDNTPGTVNHDVDSKHSQTVSHPHSGGGECDEPVSWHPRPNTRADFLPPTKPILRNEPLPVLEEELDESEDIDYVSREEPEGEGFADDMETELVTIFLAGKKPRIAWYLELISKLPFVHDRPRERKNEIIPTLISVEASRPSQLSVFRWNSRYKFVLNNDGTMKWVSRGITKVTYAGNISTSTSKEDADLLTAAGLGKAQRNQKIFTKMFRILFSDNKVMSYRVTGNDGKPVPQAIDYFKQRLETLRLNNPWNDVEHRSTYNNTLKYLHNQLILSRLDVQSVLTSQTKQLDFGRLGVSLLPRRG